MSLGQNTTILIRLPNLFVKSLFTKKKMLNIFNLKLKNNKLANAWFTNHKNGNETGKTRHYPPSNKEWFNSIYAYNKNTPKLLPLADKVILKLIKSYFNLYSRYLEKKTKSPRLRLRIKRLSTNRLLVSRAELKHTSDKVVVTIYVYNRQMQSYTIKPFLSFFTAAPQAIKKKARYYMFIRSMLLKVIGFKVISKVRKEKNLLFKSLNLEKNLFKNYEKQYYKNYILKSLKKEMLYIYLKQIIYFNESKFENTFLLPFTRLIEKVYNKKVEFNLVNLKYLHLNSHIMTDTIVLKLKNRKNRILRVLKAVLSKFKLPLLDKSAVYDDVYNRQKKRQNLKFNHYSDFFKSEIQKNDTLDQLLKKVFPKNLMQIANSLNQKEIKMYNLERERETIGETERETEREKQPASYVDVTSTVLSYIKHKSISGIRIEAAGRLSRRITAERSVFKVKYRGTIRNLDSSYKGLSTVVLRGHAKSNLQYTKLSSKTRIGSFGIKGWVSSN